jgi:hypothetical protein
MPHGAGEDEQLVTVSQQIKDEGRFLERLVLGSRLRRPSRRRWQFVR